MVAFSREVTAELAEEALFRTFHQTLGRLLPGRLVALRVVDARGLVVTDVLANGELVEEARALPPSVPRTALASAALRAHLPAELRRAESVEGRIRISDAAPLLFHGAAAGFSVALVASGELIGEIHVNYRPRRRASAFPVKADRALVAPFANHVAFVAQTRRLLRQTTYLQDSLSQLIDQANVLILATDAAGRITVWNRAMHRLTGFVRSEALGRELLPWWRELGTADLGHVVRQVLATGEAAYGEVPLPTDGGAARRATLNVVAVRGHDGAIAAALAIGQDVTALRQLQSQVIHAEKLATVGQIAAGVAHEINNPLTSIQVCAEALLRKSALAAQGRTGVALDHADADRLRKIKEGAERIRRFARDLVTYARPSGSEVEEVSVNEVIEQGLSFCEHVLEEAEASVERALAGGLPRVHAVRDQLLQIVINLVTNAAHAVQGRGGTIHVRTFRSGVGGVGFSVRDDGAGIQVQDCGKIFDPFFTTKAAGRGTGLGLAVVRNIVYSHGGQITFQSRPGDGTTFVVTLPLAHIGSPSPGDLPTL